MTLRLKLVALVTLASVGCLLLVLADTLFQARVEKQLDAIHRTYLPKLRVRPQLEAGFERLVQLYSDAGGAAEADLLVKADEKRTELIDLVKGSRFALTVGQIAALQLAIDEYASTASRVAQTMISGDDPDGSVVAAMQSRRDHADALIDTATHIDENELERSFETARAYQSDATRARLLVSSILLLLMILGAIYGARAMTRSVDALVAGFVRFGENKLDQPIVVGDDELGDVAQHANKMADQLVRLDVERTRAAWVRTGVAGLNDAVRGEQEPTELAQSVVTYLARYTGAAVGAVYYGNPAGPFTRIGGYALPKDLDVTSFALGDGLVGQAATVTEVTVIESPKHALPMRSGIVDATPRAVAYLPIARGTQVHGILELGVPAEWKPEATELLELAQETIAIAMEVARSRSASRALLVRTQAQATELEEARAKLEQKAEELARASEYKSQFLASMSHELRTPLNAIIGFSELMYDGVLDLDQAQEREYIGDILTSGRHLLQLINDVLDLSKVEAGKLEFFPESVDLSRVTSEVLAVLRTSAAKANVTIDTEIAPGLGELVLDPARLKQVLYNYLSNALKFTPEKGRIIVRARPAGEGDVRLEVVDTGPGIPPEELAKLFSDFQQTEDGAKKVASTGLGLSLTKRLVEAQGGSVGATSVVGTGSTFYAVLPRVTSRGGIPAQALTPPVRRAGAPTVLVIEDDAADRERLVSSLARAGYAVDIAATGADAIARCKDRTYDAITLDLFLPDMTGLEVLAKLRAGKNTDVPVIVVTVVAEPGAVAGFTIHDVLQKPLDETTLIASLLRAGVQAHDNTSIVLVVDDDPASLKVMAATLTQLGYLAVCEQDSARGLQAAIEQPPAAIVLDLIMPGMTGFEVLVQLRNNPATRTVPVIVWTSKDLTSAELAQLRAAASAVISKGHDGNARVIAELATYAPVPIEGTGSN